MIRITGLFIMVLAFGLAGVMKAEELKNRIRLLEDLQNMILSLKSQMNYFREPLQILFRKMAETGDSRAFSLLGACVPGIDGKSREISEIWAESTKYIYGKTSLTDEDKEIIMQIGTYLGQTDFAGQQIQFQCTEERIRQQINQAREIYGKKGPMYRKAGFLVGAAAALVVL